MITGGAATLAIATGTLSLAQPSELYQTDRGRTTIEAVKVPQAAADLERAPSVTASSARLVDDEDGRQLRTRIDVLTDADLAAVRRATDEVYERVSKMPGDDQLPTRTRIRPIGGRPPRVR